MNWNQEAKDGHRDYGELIKVDTGSCRSIERKQIGALCTDFCFMDKG